MIIQVAGFTFIRIKSIDLPASPTDVAVVKQGIEV
jgi:hypothetical protein